VPEQEQEREQEQEQEHEQGRSGKRARTPPGFSRWSFNFSLQTTSKGSWTPPGFSRWCFNFGALRNTVLNPETEIDIPPAEAWWCPRRVEVWLVAVKLKDHRLKPGGVLAELESGL